MTEFEIRSISTGSKRGPVVSGRVPDELYKAVKGMIDGNTYRTMNDVVETAICRLVAEEQNMRDGGDKIGV